ncbi:MAG: hypothetical protein NUV76_12420 [Candidatus Kuenenia sp.]|nr:hypothetical protein [Candidatus Kuenenia sp.]
MGLFFRLASLIPCGSTGFGKINLGKKCEWQAACDDVLAAWVSERREKNSCEKEGSMKIGSILCNGGEKKDYRRNIYLVSGRLYCDGNDITPHASKYRGGRNKVSRAAGISDAIRDVKIMYYSGVWQLRLVK